MTNSWMIAKHILRKMFEEPRWKVIALLLALLMFNGTYRANSFAAMVNEPITAWVFPHMTSWMALQFTFAILFLLLICDSPYSNESSYFVLARCGKMKWCKGVLLANLIITLLFVLYILLLSVIFLIPSLSFSNSWGKVLTTFAKRPDFNGEYFTVFAVKDSIIQNYSPLRAMILFLTIMMLCFYLLSTILTVFNLLFKNKTGLGVATCIALLDFFVYNDVNGDMVRFSPVSLTRLMNIDTKAVSYFPSAAHAYGYLSVLLLLFTVLYLYIAHQKSINNLIIE